MVRKKIKIPFVDYSSSVPLIKYRLENGSEGIAILDTGSELSLFDDEYVRRHRDQFSLEYTDEIIDIVGIQSRNEKAVINATAIVSTNGHIVKLTGMMLSMSHITETIRTNSVRKDICISAMVGSDVLSKLNAKIDYKNNCLILPS